MWGVACDAEGRYWDGWRLRGPTSGMVAIDRAAMPAYPPTGFFRSLAIGARMNPELAGAS